MELKEWQEKILYSQKSAWDRLPREEEPRLMAYCEDYKAFLDAGKTERACVKEAVRLAEQRGWRPYRRGMALEAGDKVYCNNRGKMLMLAVIGKKGLEDGAQITAAHIDSPRLDLKPSPLYEEAELCYLKTHYYGGVRKYQWVTIPLQLRGVVV